MDLMATKIGVVINTLNEEKNIERAVKSVSWADEILVCDMYSDDNTAVVAKKLGAKIIFHKRLQFVEPARNFAISKSSGDWVFILDADEVVPEGMEKKLKDIAMSETVTSFVEIPRKNIIFGKWMKASMWWPDYNIRFFKKDSVSWSNKIHRPPKTEGQGLKLPADERWAIEHHNYVSVTDFMRRMDRYTDVQAKELKEEGYEFDYKDLITKPVSEFLGRYFANRGFDDGLHGLSLSLLQAFSFFVMYLKVWEMKEFNQKDIQFDEIKDVFKVEGGQIDYWLKYGNLSKNPVKRLLQKAKNKLN